MSRWSAWVLLLALAVALALRIPQLGNRPLHNDEAVNAFKLSELWLEGRYKYDPDEYHGPVLHYASLPFVWLSGIQNRDQLCDGILRWVTAAFGVGLVLLVPLMTSGLGRGTTAWAAVFTAISPAMVFYSRYFIHEMLLVFFTALTLGAGWRMFLSGSVAWGALAGAGVGLMYATKETFVITMAAVVGGGCITALWCSPRPMDWRGILQKIPWRACFAAVGTGLLLWSMFFTSFFTNMGGLLDSIQTYLPWLKRAGGHSPHIHPWYFYLERIAWFHPPKSPVWSEGLIVGLAVLGMITAFFRDATPLHRFLMLYTVLLTAAYSFISYKTPWCMLSFLLGMILLAAIGVTRLVDRIQSLPGRVLLMTLLAGLSIQLTWQAWRASFTHSADRRNPYVYAQTGMDLAKLVERIEGISRISTTGTDTVIKIIAPGGDYWPLPWALKKFKNVGWYEQLPEDPFAPIVVAGSKLEARLDDRSERKWLMVGLNELRPGKFFETYVELELWKKYVATLPRPED